MSQHQLRKRLLRVESLEERLALASDIVTGTDTGIAARVKAFSGANGSEQANFLPHGDGYTAGVRVATGDINGDGRDDFITGAAINAHVKVFDGITHAEIRSFLAYPEFTGGVFVAGGDINGDARSDIITGSDTGIAARVRVFSGVDGSELANFLAFEESFTGGVTVAAADVNGDGTSDIVVDKAPGAATHVKVIDGTRLDQILPNGQISDSALLASFFAFDPSFTGGVFVAAGYVNGDATPDIIVGAGPGAFPHVKVIDGTRLGQVLPNGQINDSALLASFFAYGQSFVGGVRVASGDVNGDGRDDIITGAGTNGSSHVKVFDGVTFGEIRSFLAYPGFTGGVFVAGNNPPRMDFGDAPTAAQSGFANSYPTLRVDNGARHLKQAGLWLGSNVDLELDGQPNVMATGDDANGNADEDGVELTSLLIVGQLVTVNVTASAEGLLNAWIDFNRDGSWSDSGEQIFLDQPLTAGVNSLSFSVPISASIGTTFARFRLNSIGGLSFVGAAADGEVEDYQVTILPVPDRVGVFRQKQFREDANGNGQWNGALDGDRLFVFGGTNDTPLIGDWDGDGYDEIGVQRGNQYYLDRNGNGVWDGNAAGDLLYVFRNAGDKPLVGDWDGDGDDEIGSWNAGLFYIDLNSNGVWDGTGAGDQRFTFGLSNDTPLAGDWDGDGDDQIGVHRGNVFFLDVTGDGIWNGNIGGDRQITFGISGDTPVSGDWDIDGADDIGVRRNNAYYLDANGNGVFNGTAGGDMQYAFGVASDLPLIGHWRPNPQIVTGNDKLGVRRQATDFEDANGNGELETAAEGDRQVTFGVASDIGIAGDWDGDGFDDVGVQRGNQYYLDQNGNGVFDGPDVTATFRNVGDKPLVGDWDGDNDDQLGSWNAGLFYLDLNSNGAWDGTGAGDQRFAFGLASDTPLAGDWNGDGNDDIGVHRGNVFYLDANGNGVWNGIAGGDRQITFGINGDVPVTGDWNGDGIDDVGVKRNNNYYLDANGNDVFNGATGGDLDYVYGLSSDQPLRAKWRPVGALMAAGGPTASFADAAPLTADELAPILQQAIILWAKTGLTSTQVQTLNSVQVVILDLPGAQLGQSLGGTILIDRDAAGYGWFVDPTPADNSKFSVPQSLIPNPQSLDLLSAVLHELGHELGFDHDDDLEAMFETLAAGTRRLLN